MVDPMPLACQEVGKSGTGMRRCHLRDWGDNAVWRNRDVIRLRHVRDFLSFGESANLLEVRLNDIDRLLFEKFAISPTHVQVFSAGNRRRGGVADVGHGVYV